MIGNSGVIGDYELRGHLGGGGQGCVYYAVNWLTGEECALKIYHDDFDERRVVREASSLKGRNIPCFPRILDSGSVNLEGRDRLYVAFEFIEGVTLESRLIRGLQRTWCPGPTLPFHPDLLLPQATKPSPLAMHLLPETSPASSLAAQALDHALHTTSYRSSRWCIFRPNSSTDSGRIRPGQRLRFGAEARRQLCHRIAMQNH
jgi:serine/threonine protein kinase